MPVISVVIPTYKPGNYISDCLNSLCEQSLPIDKFEVLIILNGSKEPYYSFIQNIIEQLDIDLNVKLFYIENKGVSFARNYGIEKSRGEFISFIDDDDLLSNNYFSDLYKTLLKENEKFRCNIIACSNVKTFDIISQTYGSDYLRKAYEKCSSIEFNIMKYRSFLSNVWGKLIPRSVINNVRFNNKLYISEDAVFMFEISKDIDKILLTEENVYYIRRIRPGSALTTKRSKTEKMSIFINLLSAYTNIYLKSPMQYSFSLYLTRVFAAFRNLIKQ